MAEDSFWWRSSQSANIPNRDHRRLIGCDLIDSAVAQGLREEGHNYGRAHAWPHGAGPGLRERPVKILLDLDADKFKVSFLKAAQQ